MMKKKWMAIGLVPVVALMVAAAPTRGPEVGGLGCGCGDRVVMVQRAQDPRVTRALLEAAGRMTGQDRLEELVAIAQNSTISADSELALIAAAGSLTGSDRRQLLSMVARTARVQAAGAE